MKNQHKRQYLYNILEDGHDSDDMKALKALHPDVSVMTVHILYCSDILNWAGCVNCANFSNNKKEHVVSPVKEPDVTIEDWMFGSG